MRFLTSRRPVPGTGRRPSTIDSPTGRGLAGVCLALAVSIVLLQGCSIPGRPIEPAKLKKFEPEAEVVPVWYRQPPLSDQKPVGGMKLRVVDDRLFVAESDGLLRALDPGNGRAIWESRLALGTTGVRRIKLSSGLGYHDGRLVLGTDDGDVFAVDASNGTLLWRASVSSEVLVPPEVAEGIVVVKANDGSIVAFDIDSGKRRWSYQATIPALTLRGASRVLIEKGIVYSGFSNGKMLALKLSDGEVQWETIVALPQGRSELERLVDLDADPVWVDGVIYAAAYKGKVAAISAASGRILWSRDMSVFKALAVSGNLLFAVDEQSKLWALDRQSGAVRWQQDALYGRDITAVAILETDVVVGDQEGFLHWLAIDNGRIRARYRADNLAFTEPALVWGRSIIATAGSGAIYALQLVRKD